MQPNATPCTRGNASLRAASSDQKKLPIADLYADSLCCLLLRCRCPGPYIEIKKRCFRAMLQGHGRVTRSGTQNELQCRSAGRYPNDPLSWRVRCVAQGCYRNNRPTMQELGRGAPMPSRPCRCSLRRLHRMHSANVHGLLHL